MTAAADAPVVLRDVFPAEVTVAGTVYRSARAVLTADRLLVYVAVDGRPTLVADLPYDPAASTVPRYNAAPREPAHLLLVDGRTAHINRQRGCGCGNPLKAWQPWQPYRVGV